MSLIQVENYLIDSSRIKEKIEYDVDSPYEWAYEQYKKGKVPTGWFVHGRKDKEHLDTNYCIQCTEDWSVAKSYGRSGTIWLINTNENTRILNIYKKQEADKFYNWLLDNIHDYDTIVSDIEISTGIKFEDFTEIKLMEILDDEYNPKNITETAGAYDNRDWQVPLYDYKGGIDFVITYDGAVLLADSKDRITAIQVARNEEELEDIKQKHGDRLLYESEFKVTNPKVMYPYKQKIDFDKFKHIQSFLYHPDKKVFVIASSSDIKFHAVIWQEAGFEAKDFDDCVRGIFAGNNKHDKYGFIDFLYEIHDLTYDNAYETLLMFKHIGANSNTEVIGFLTNERQLLGELITI